VNSAIKSKRPKYPRKCIHTLYKPSKNSTVKSIYSNPSVKLNLGFSRFYVKHFTEKKKRIKNREEEEEEK